MRTLLFAKMKKNFLSVFDIYNYFDTLCEEALILNDEEFMWIYITKIYHI
jgi:hypothetical protein